MPGRVRGQKGSRTKRLRKPPQGGMMSGLLPRTKMGLRLTNPLTKVLKNLPAMVLRRRNRP